MSRIRTTNHSENVLIEESEKNRCNNTYLITKYYEKTH
jgi:hypothetical protein